MAGAVIALRESRIVWRLGLSAKLVTLLSVALLAAYGLWMAAATALVVGVVGWRHQPQPRGSLLVGADPSFAFAGGLDTYSAHRADLAHRAALNKTPVVSAFDAFGLLIITLRGKPATVIVARDSATPAERRLLGLWLKKMPSAANSAMSARS